MSCTDTICGTGSWTGPKPGDPDNNLTLSANAVRGGIDVSWSYPNTNPYAVAYTILYRGLSADLNAALELGKVGGSIYFDKLDPAVPTQYYYWIQVMSTNGTLGDPIGPASTIAKPASVYSLEELSGLIDDGVLAQSLKTEIDRIPSLDSRLLQEIQDRIGSNSALAESLQTLVDSVDGTMTLVAQEVTERRDGDSALVDAINILAAKTDDNAAAIIEEQTVRTTKTDSIAQDITTLYAHVDDFESSVQTEATVRADADSSLAQQITTIQTTMGDNIAQVQTSLTTHIDTVDGKVTDIGALWTGKVSVNGLVGGFGVYNDGREVEAGFDVDRFWIGKDSAIPNAVKPFIVDNDIVYIDKARIRDADIDSLKLAGEAVTVPVVSTSADKQRRGTGDSNYVVVNEGYMSMTQAGMLYVLATTAQGFYKNTANWRFRLRINGNIVRSIMGGVANDAPTFSASVAVPLGTAHVQLEWAAVSDVILGYTELFMMGVKR